jgi:hypothetical protein
MNASFSPSLITTLIVAGLGTLYFVPTLVAGWRGHAQTTAIFVLNLLLGFTVLGWVGALVWACMNSHPACSTEVYTFMPYHRNVPAPLSPAERRMLVEVER